MERCLHQTGGLAAPGQVDRDSRCRQRPRRRTANFVTAGAPWEDFGQNSGTNPYGNAHAVTGADSNATDSATEASRASRTSSAATTAANGTSATKYVHVS